MNQIKLDYALQLIREINQDEFKLQFTEQNTLDNLILELNHLKSRIYSQKQRTKEIIDHITDCCLGDLSKKLPISENEDELDVISLGFNTFLEELTATTVSIEELEEANKEILEREKKLDEAQSIAQIGSWEYSFESGITNISKELLRILEVEKIENNLRKLFKSKIQPDDLYKYEILKHINKISTQKNEFEFTLNMGNGRTKILLLTTIFDESKNKIIGTAQDITERKKIEEKLKQLELDNLEHKRKIIEAILVTKEKEQKRIAEELHDDIGSSLMLIKFAAHKLDIGKTEKEELFNSVSEVIQKVRNLSNELSPTVLEAFGLINALRHFCDKLKKSTDKEIHFTSFSDELEILTKEEEIALFRVIQEIINNILKYAEASEIEITLSIKNKCLEIQIIDNGNGFIPDDINHSKYSHGLLNIESRIDYLNGSIQFTKLANKGTLVQINKVLDYSL